VLGHPDLGVGVRRHLGQVGHDQHLVLRRQPPQRAPDRQRGPAADAGVDLVEHQGGRRFGEHEPQREHGPRQFATRGHPGQGQRRRPRVGGESDLDVVAGVVPAHGDDHLGLGHGQLDEVVLDRPGQAGRGRPPGGGDGGGLGGLDLAGGHQPVVEIGGPAVVVLQLGEPLAQPLALGDHLAQCLPVLAAQVAQQLAAGPHDVQPLGVLLDALAGGPQVGGQVPDLGGHRPKPVLQGGERSAARHGGDRHADGVGGGRGTAGGTAVAVAAERGERLGRGLAVGGRVGQGILLGLQRLVLVGPGDGRAGDLVDLVADQVQLPGPGPLVAAHGRQRVGYGLDLGPGAPQRPGVHPAEAVERLPLGRGVEQRLVGVLAVEVDQHGAQLGQLARRGQPAVDVGSAAARAGNGPGQHDLVVAAREHEAALDPRLVGARAHEHRIGPPADQQLDRVHDHRFPRTGLASHRGHAPAQHQPQLGDHAQVPHRQLDQHRALPSPVIGRSTRTWSSGCGGSRGARR
jgi:hypothetical protein